MFHLRSLNGEVYLVFANCMLTLLRILILDIGTFYKKSVVEMLKQGNKFYSFLLNNQWKQWKGKI